MLMHPEVPATAGAISPDHSVRGGKPPLTKPSRTAGLQLLNHALRCNTCESDYHVHMVGSDCALHQLPSAKAALVDNRIVHNRAHFICEYERPLPQNPGFIIQPFLVNWQKRRAVDVVIVINRATFVTM